MFVCYGVLVFSLIIMIAYYSIPIQRSLVLEARAQFATIVVHRTTRWYLGPASICLPLPPRRGVVKDSSEAANCGDVEKEIRGRQIVVSWSPSDIIELRQVSGGPFEILIWESTDSVIAIDGDLQSVPTGSRIILPKERFSTLGALSFEGAVEAGRAIEDGSSGVLFEGRYQWRVLLPFRTTTDIVGEGSFFRGDTVSITNATGEQLSVYGFVNSLGNDIQGFGITAARGSSDSGSRPVLRLIRYGFSPTLIEPGWSDRALADRFVLAIITIITMTLAIYGLFNTFRSAAGEIASSNPQKRTGDNDQVTSGGDHVS